MTHYKSGLSLQLIAYSVISVTFSLLLAGTALDYLHRDIHNRTAIQQTEKAFAVLEHRVKSIEKLLFETSEPVSRSQGIIAALNLINGYQDIDDYVPLIFDEEKKRLSGELLKHIKASRISQLTLYDFNGDLTAFAYWGGDSFRYGFKSYEGSRPVIKIAVDSDSTIQKWETGELPGVISPSKQEVNKRDSFVLRAGESGCKIVGQQLVMSFSRVILRYHPDGKYKPIGSLEAAYSLDKELLEDISTQAQARFAMSLSSDAYVNAPDDLGSLHILPSGVASFAQIGVHETKWLDHDQYFIHAHQLPADNGMIYFLSLLPKSDLLAAIHDTRVVLFVIFIVAALLTISLGVFWLGRSITKPLEQLVDQAKRIEDGDYSEIPIDQSKNEIGILSKALDKVVNAVKARETDLLYSRNELNQEVEERKRIQRYLGEILDAMPSVVVGINNEGVITHWNRHASEATGRSIAEVIGQPVEKHLGMLKGYLEEVHEAASTGAKLKLSRVSYGHRGERRHADVLVYPLSSSGTEGAVIRVDDITERVNMEEMMAQTEKMLSVGGLAGGMAHELNNPLGGMVQGIQNVQRRLSPDLAKNRSAASRIGITLEQMQQYFSDREINKVLDSIANAGERASMIVNNMLRFTRKSEMTFQLVNMTDLIDETIELAEVDYDLKKKYDFRKITIERKYQKDMRPVNCIPGEIQQVILNLIRNTAQAFASNNHESDHALITLYAKQDSGKFYLEIEDNGPGINEQTKKRIFEPFFTTKAPGEGTGLGLSVSYYIIHDEHHGEMNVESTLGKGTKFSIMIPSKADA